MKVSTFVHDISFNSQHIKNSSHGIGVHSCVTLDATKLIFALKSRDRSFCSTADLVVPSLRPQN